MITKNGFTIVELIVGVALIGVLVILAGRTYQKYTTRALQSEAKSKLLQIHTLEQTFHLNKGTYTSCLKVIGYAPNGSARPSDQKEFYSTGFTSAAAQLKNCGPGTSEWISGENQPCNCYVYDPAGTCQTACSVGYGSTLFDANTTAQSGYGILHLPEGPGAPVLSNMSFVAKAIGTISSERGIPASKFDYWTINQDRTLVNVNAGF